MTETASVPALEHLARKIMVRAASLPAHLALRVANLKPISTYIDRQYENSLGRDVSASSLMPNEALVVAGLARDGVFVTHLDALGLNNDTNDGIMACGRQVAELIEVRAAAMKERRPSLVFAGPDDLLRYPMIYRWGLNAVILRIIQAYLRLPVAYDGALVFHTPADGREIASRMWHKDREDRRVIKVGLYLNDVDETGGPFQTLNKAVVRADERFKYPLIDSAGLPRTLGVQASAETITTCTGRAGSLVFADTARFYHRGKPATGHDRLSIFYAYFARPPRHPFYCQRSGLSRQQIMNVIEGLDADQQACALWRDSLPWIARMIPPSRT